MTFVSRLIPNVSRRVTARVTGLVLGLGLLAGCAVDDLDGTPPPMGRFLLGHNIAIVVDEAEVGPASRKIDDATWVGALRTAVNDRFSRYDGDRYYHISVAVLGYVLAQPGIPVVAAPKSVLIADVRIFDDTQGGKPITEEPKQFTVFEEGGEVLVGSGHTRSAEEQAASLSRNLAKQIHDWMLDNPEWFGDAAEMDPATTSPGRPVQPLPPLAGEG
ncbi:MAG: hypothetical protein KDK28_20590 [Maritimibacter sp.]|nr:hypothetical protein [Maritimibacter sp.]